MTAYDTLSPAHGGADGIGEAATPAVMFPPPGRVKVTVAGLGAAHQPLIRTSIVAVSPEPSGVAGDADEEPDVSGMANNAP
jgi:hypothetical protein